MTPPIALLTAIPDEIAALGAHLRLEPEPVRIADMAFQRGALDGQPVVVAESGIGKVNAALATTLLLDRFGCRGIIFAGVAGGLGDGLGIGDVVVADSTFQHDYGTVTDLVVRAYRAGAWPFGEPEDVDLVVPGTLLARLKPALDGLALSPVPAEVMGTERATRLVFGRIATGDSFMNCEATRTRLAGTYGSQAVDMESAAVAQVAERFGVPWVIIRAISDLGDEESEADFFRFLPHAARTAATIVRHVAAVL